MLEFSLYLFTAIMAIKMICSHIELVGWVHYSNQLKKQDFQKILDLYDGDKECAIIEYKQRFRGIDSDLGYKKWEFENGKSNSHYNNHNNQVVKPDYSLINNKAKKLVDFWSYYFDQVLCRKDLRNATDLQIKIIYYARLISTMIDMTIAPQPIAVQFIGLFLQQLEVAAIRIVSKKIEEEELPEPIKKKLEKAA